MAPLFVDIEAGVDSGEERSSDGEENWDDEVEDCNEEEEELDFNVEHRQDPIQPPSPYTFYYDPDQFHQEAESLANEVRQRALHQVRAPSLRHGDADLPRAARLPSADDMLIFEVKVKRGKETNIILRLWNRSCKKHDEEWGCAFTNPHIPGRIYVEAKSNAAFIRLCSGILNIRLRTLYIVPIDDRESLLSAKEIRKPLEIGSLVMVKSGLYAGDFGIIEEYNENLEYLSIKIVPRVLDTGQKKRPKKTQRPKPTLFTRATAESRFGAEEITGQDPFVVNGASYSKEGFQFLRMDAFSVKLTRPLLQEIKIFLDAARERVIARRTETQIEETDGEYVPTDLEVLNEAGIRPGAISLPSVFRKGDTVKFTSGILAGEIGTITDAPLVHTALIRVGSHEKDIEEPLVSVDLSCLLRVYKAGDHVEVKFGRYVGQCGFVTAARDGVVEVQDIKVQGEPIIIPNAFVDYSYSNKPILPTPTTVETDAPSQSFEGPISIEDELARVFKGARVYVWKGTWKGKVGIVHGMSGLYANVEFTSSLALGSAMKQVRREELVSATMNTLLNGMAPILTPAAYPGFKKFLQEVLASPLKQADLPTSRSHRGSTSPASGSRTIDLESEETSGVMNYNHDASGHLMWIFDEDIAKLRSTRKFIVHIDSHQSAKVAGIKTGALAIDASPLVHPLDETQRAEVLVEFTDGRSNFLSELLPVKDLSPKNTKAGQEHAIIRGDRKGTLVWHVRNDKKGARVFVEGTDKRKDGFYVDPTDLCYVEKP